MKALFGITHRADGEPILRMPRVLKVSIGVPRGPAIYTWIQRSERGTLEWVFRCATKEGNKLNWFVSKERVPVVTADGSSNRAAAEAKYRELSTKVAESGYPMKLPYFTFTHATVDKAGKELHEPDFEAIERHGACPTSVDIVLMDNEPLSAEYAMWSASELRCHGDGQNAMRIMSMADKDTAEKFKGERYFPIVNGCATMGCSYAQEQGGKPAPCKPSGDLSFHLAHDIRVGTRAYFHTSGIRSIQYLFSGLADLGDLTPGLRGVPCSLSIAPYKTKHNGQAATQYGVRIEVKAETIAALRRKLDAAQELRQIAPNARQIEAPGGDAGAEDAEEIPVSAAAMTAEFYPEAMDAEVEDAPEEGPGPATQERQENLKEKLATQALKEKIMAKQPAPAATTESEPKEDLF